MISGFSVRIKNIYFYKFHISLKGSNRLIIFLRTNEKEILADSRFERLKDDNYLLR
jgi:hypothetical protein